MPKCPRCGVIDTSALLHPSGITRLRCPRCGFTYQLITGRVAEARVPGSEHINAGAAVGARTRLIRLALDGGHEELLSVPDSTALPDVIARDGDTVSAVHAYGPEGLGALLRIENLSRRQAYELMEPAWPSRIASAFPFAALGGLLFVLLSGLGLNSAPVALSLAAALGGAGYVLFSRATRAAWLGGSKGSTASEPLSALSDRRHDLLRAEAEQREEQRRERAATERMRRLGEMMRTTDPTRFAGRLSTIERALALLDRQQALRADLLDNLGRAIGLVTIELESAAVIGEAAASTLTEVERLKAEWTAVRETIAEIGRELEANEEVERLLAGDERAISR
jgi:Zn ribbon nucleic-acid-binding protein